MTLDAYWLGISALWEGTGEDTLLLEIGIKTASCHPVNQNQTISH